MRRSFVAVVVACLLATGCAEESTETSEAAVATTIEMSASDVPATTAESATPSGDFGSRYNGAPVAFWFWAPY